MPRYVPAGGRGGGGVYIDWCIMGPLQLGSRYRNFSKKIFYIMGYNLKNTSNGKSISKIPKRQSLRSLVLKSKFVSVNFWKI